MTHLNENLFTKPITIYDEYKLKSRKKCIRAVVGKAEYYMKFGAIDNSSYK